MGRVLVNEFSWSKSRHEKFRECLRAYYFYYYRSWGGWDAKAPQEARELYLLKKLSNRFTWAGSVVHDAIRDVLLDLRAGRRVVEEEVLARVRQQMREDYRHSSRQAYRQQKLRKNFVGLVEHEYQEAIPPEEWKRNWETVEQALRWFFASRWQQLAVSLRPHQWLEVDEGAVNSNFDWKGVRVYAIPDLAFVDETGTGIIVDWKTGKARDGYDEQVVGYAVYLSHRYRLPLEKIQAVLVYLNDGVEVTVRVDPAAVERFEAYFASSVASMKEVLEAPEQNRPRAEDAFPMTENRESCGRCVFRRACGRHELPLVSHVAPERTTATL